MSLFAVNGPVVGIQLPIQSQSTAYADQWESDAGIGELTRVARAADESGFGYVAVCDHVAIPREKAAAMSTQWWDTIATLGYLAGITERVRLLSHVAVVAYRHPLITAKAWSTLDVLSGGRAILGVGAGHVEAEFEALGAEFSRRGRDLDEAIDALRQCFTSEYPSHHGRRWSFDELGQQPRPVQPGGPPIWIGGSSPAAIRRAAQRGDGWLPQGPLTAELVAEIARVRHDAGRSELPFAVGALAGPVHVGSPSWDLGGPAISGEPGKVAHILGKLADLGADQIQVRFPSRDVEEAEHQIRRFGTEVLPLLAGG